MRNVFLCHRSRNMVSTATCIPQHTLILHCTYWHTNNAMRVALLHTLFFESSRPCWYAHRTQHICLQLSLHSCTARCSRGIHCILASSPIARSLVHLFLAMPSETTQIQLIHLIPCVQMRVLGPHLAEQFQICAVQTRGQTENCSNCDNLPF